MAASFLRKMSSILSLLCILFPSICYTIQVPLVAWSYGDRSVDAPSNILSGHSVEASDVFKNQFEPFIKSGHHIFFFLQDELSIDDFTKYANSFQHLQKVLNKEKSFMVPSVSQEKKSIYDLIRQYENVEDVFNSGDLSTWSYNKANNVVLFHLEPVAGTTTEGRRDILNRNDALREEILRKIKKENLDNFAVVLTADEPSQAIASLLEHEEVDDSNPGSRQLLSTPAANNNGSFFNNSMAFLFVKHIRFGLPGSMTDLISANTTWEDDKSTSGCGLQCIRLKTKSIKAGNITSFEMLLAMDVSNSSTGEWNCMSITVSVKIGGETLDNIGYNCSGNYLSAGFASSLYNIIRAPIGMSYACHNMTFLPSNRTRTNLTLSLGGLQIQPNITGLNKFGSAYHCVGFFSLEILTGIFVTVVLTLGLFLGISMMMAIQTQDRFDDPKGPMISVPTQD